MMAGDVVPLLLPGDEEAGGSRTLGREQGKRFWLASLLATKFQRFVKKDRGRRLVIDQDADL
jgi:hypothetical protein